jgi:hypothetical protein
LVVADSSTSEWSLIFSSSVGGGQLIVPVESRMAHPLVKIYFEYALGGQWRCLGTVPLLQVSSLWLASTSLDLFPGETVDPSIPDETMAVQLMLISL